MRAAAPAAEWASYLERYHREHPGITEDVLSSATDEAGRSPYDWLLEPLRSGAGQGVVVDIGCGSAPVARRLGAGHRYVGVDRSEAELGRARAASGGSGAVAVALVRGDAAALPLADGTAHAVVASMMLMVAIDVDGVLAEVARVLRPGGTFVATVPTRSRDDDPSTELFREVLGVLGQRQVRYPGSLEPSQVSAAGLQLQADERRGFTRRVAADECDLVVDSFYAVGAGAQQRAEALARLRGRAAAGPFPLGYPLRRLVAVRTRPR